MSLYRLSSSQNVFFLHSQFSSEPKLDVNDKIVSLFVKNPFCTPDIKVVIAAQNWRRSLSEVGFFDIDAFPGQSGEILISALTLKGNFCFEVTVEPDLTLSVAFEHGEDLVFSYDKLSSEKSKEKLFEAVRHIWISSVGFIQINSTPALRKIALSA